MLTVFALSEGGGGDGFRGGCITSNNTHTQCECDSSFRAPSSSLLLTSSEETLDTCLLKHIIPVSKPATQHNNTYISLHQHAQLKHCVTREGRREEEAEEEAGRRTSCEASQDEELEAQDS